jgi:methionyl-tRNA formyltransferase
MTLPLAPARPRRIAFAGTPDDAVPALQALAAAGLEVPVVVTGEPRRRSRRGSDAASPVAEAAAELGLPVSHSPADLAGCDADCAVVVAYGRLIDEDLLAATPMLNLHFSLLPRWRGAAPVERALLAGDDRTGVSLMSLEPTLDTGPVYWCHEMPIGPADTAAQLRRRLAQEGAERLAASLSGGLGTPQPQAGEPTYARKLTPADRQIDWSRPTAVVDRQIRVGGAWTTLDGERFIVREATPLPDKAVAPQPGSSSTGPADRSPDPRAESGDTPTQAERGAPPGTLVDDAVATGDAHILLRTVQPAGRPALDAQDWLRGARLRAGTRFG